jgi:hypothetical protein
MAATEDGQMTARLQFHIVDHGRNRVLRDKPGDGERPLRLRSTGRTFVHRPDTRELFLSTTRGTLFIVPTWALTPMLVVLPRCEADVGNLREVGRARLLAYLRTIVDKELAQRPHRHVARVQTDGNGDREVDSQCRLNCGDVVGGRRRLCLAASNNRQQDRCNPASTKYRPP